LKNWQAHVKFIFEIIWRALKFSSSSSSCSFPIFGFEDENEDEDDYDFVDENKKARSI
jgi:hypothetical protein